MATKTTAMVISVLCLGALSLAGCDDEENNAAMQGGGDGSTAPTNVTNSGDGFCSPQGGNSVLGDPAYTSNSTAKIDTDGDPLMQGHDPDWQAGTSGTVNNQPVNSAQYNYVVMSPAQMAANNVSLGDWALVTNNATGQQAWARVEDKGPAGGTGEISESTATAVGIKFQSNAWTVGNPSVTVQAYAGTAEVQGDCPSQVAAQ
jgi:hypothetical protein